MPNAIKYNTSAETLALKKGNFWIGTGDVGKGPTSSTGYYNGITPPSGGYTIYLNKASGGPSIYTVITEAQLTGLTSTIAGQTLTTSGACLNWFTTQTDKMIFNTDFEPIITDGLIFYVVPSKVMSYISGNTSVYDVTNNYSGVSQNGVSFLNENEGVWSFDGTDDNILFENLSLGTTTGATFMFWSTNNSTLNALQSPFGYHRSYWTIRSSQTYLFVGYGGIEHSSSFERSTSFSNTGTNWRFLAVTVNGSSGSFYKDGNKLSNFSDMPSTIDSNSSMYIGRRAFSTPYSYDGKIGNILIYNRPLTDDEIVYNYEATGKRFVSLEVQSLVVAGGGGGGSGKGGGGGAGGLLTGTTTSLTTNTNYTITIGGGGAVDTNGSNSVFNLTTSNGGGFGGRIINTTAGTGGCGGGAGGAHSGIGAGYSGGTPFSGQGYKGGGNYNGVTVLTNSGGGGGGGAGMAGYNALETSGATGGDGLYFSEYSTLGGSPSGWFAGGGGGGAPYNNDRGFGGKGGGGQGAQNLPGYGTQNASGGTVNTGGGGGGGSIGGSGSGFYDGKSGGSGIVILRIPDVYTARFSSGVTSSVTKSGGYKYYKVTATSTTSETVSFL